MAEELNYKSGILLVKKDSEQSQMLITKELTELSLFMTSLIHHHSKILNDSGWMKLKVMLKKMWNYFFLEIRVILLIKDKLRQTQCKNMLRKSTWISTRLQRKQLIPLNKLSWEYLSVSWLKKMLNSQKRKNAPIKIRAVVHRVPKQTIRLLEVQFQVIPLQLPQPLPNNSKTKPWVLQCNKRT